MNGHMIQVKPVGLNPGTLARILRKDSFSFLWDIQDVSLSLKSHLYHQLGNKANIEENMTKA